MIAVLDLENLGRLFLLLDRLAPPDLVVRLVGLRLLLGRWLLGRRLLHLRLLGGGLLLPGRVGGGRDQLVVAVVVGGGEHVPALGALDFFPGTGCDGDAELGPALRAAEFDGHDGE